ncbi:LPXTG cell wall anchor domain-containing protein [Streptomyces sp. NPDC059564]|uniref:LPXTG cell wall anchor domain-containing protein n=1 Tax=Streptomyces sp. NPDC059564 TaxID=3346865 RepID=UPI00368D5625
MTTRPRLIRPSFTALAFALLVLAQALAVAVAGTAHAHGDTLKVVITGQRDGHVTADVTWENDGDAVEEAVAATVNAVSADGTRTAGPWRLVRGSGGAAAWTTAETLPPGSWTVSIDAGFPSLGHAEREIAVPVVDPAPPTASAAAPTASTPPAPAPAPSSSPASAGTPATDTDTDSTGWWTTAGVAGIALAGAAAGILLRRRRLRRR